MHDGERIVIENNEIYRDELMYAYGSCCVKRELILTREILEQALREWNIIKDDEGK